MLELKTSESKRTDTDKAGHSLLEEMREAKETENWQLLNETLLEIEKTFQPRVVAYVMRRYRLNLHLAEDVFQEALLRLYLNTDKHDTSRGDSPYIHAYASNIAIDYIRRKGNRIYSNVEESIVENSTW